MRIQPFIVNAFNENTYILYDDTKECIIIDPGCYQQNEQKEISEFIALHKLLPKLLINTHTHIDHVMGNDFIKETYHTPILMHKLDMPILESQPIWAENYGIKIKNLPAPDRFIVAGDIIHFGNTDLEVLFTPGHSPGSISLYCAKSNCVIVGDVLFYNSIGRTDFPLCSYEDLMSSITKNLFMLPEDTKVYNGHGPVTSIGREKRYNPFVLEYLEGNKN